MPDYEKLYHLLFNAATYAIESLENGGTAQAQQLLIHAQQNAEAIYMDGSE